MITRVEALSFRSLRRVAQDLDSFHILVGPNGSGKSTFFDVLGFLADFLSDGVEGAVGKRSNDPMDLFWHREGEVLEVAIEARLPPGIRPQGPGRNHVRYEAAFEMQGESQELTVAHERLAVVEARTLASPSVPAPERDTLVIGSDPAGDAVVRTRDGTCQYIYEVIGADGGRSLSRFRIGRGKSALGNLPEDEQNFPAASWLRKYLTEACVVVRLQDFALRRPSQAKGKVVLGDGSNLACMVRALEKQSPEAFDDWLAQLRAAIPGFEGVRVWERPDERRPYLSLRLAGKVEVPSFGLSDGTLRFMALSLLTHQTNNPASFLVEEPENGIHPWNIELAFQALSAVHQGQVLVATHSPLLVGLAQPEQLLCFTLDESGSTRILQGSKHPALQQWQREVDLGTLFAAGVFQ